MNTIRIRVLGLNIIFDSRPVSGSWRPPLRLGSWRRWTKTDGVAFPLHIHGIRNLRIAKDDCKSKLDLGDGENRVVAVRGEENFETVSASFGTCDRGIVKWRGEEWILIRLRPYRVKDGRLQVKFEWESEKGKGRTEVGLEYQYRDAPPVVWKGVGGLWDVWGGEEVMVWVVNAGVPPRKRAIGKQGLKLKVRRGEEERILDAMEVNEKKGGEYGEKEVKFVMPMWKKASDMEVEVEVLWREMQRRRHNRLAGFQMAVLDPGMSQRLEIGSSVEAKLGSCGVDGGLYKKSFVTVTLETDMYGPGRFSDFKSRQMRSFLGKSFAWEGGLGAVRLVRVMKGKIEFVMLIGKEWEGNISSELERFLREVDNKAIARAWRLPEGTVSRQAIEENADLCERYPGLIAGQGATLRGKQVPLLVLWVTLGILAGVLVVFGGLMWWGRRGTSGKYVEPNWGSELVSESYDPDVSSEIRTDAMNPNRPRRRVHPVGEVDSSTDEEMGMLKGVHGAVGEWIGGRKEGQESNSSSVQGVPMYANVVYHQNGEIERIEDNSTDIEVEEIEGMEEIRVQTMVVPTPPGSCGPASLERFVSEYLKSAGRELGDRATKSERRVALAGVKELVVRRDDGRRTSGKSVEEEMMELVRLGVESEAKRHRGQPQELQVDSRVAERIYQLIRATSAKEHEACTVEESHSNREDEQTNETEDVPWYRRMDEEEECVTVVQVDSGSSGCEDAASGWSPEASTRGVAIEYGEYEPVSDDTTSSNSTIEEVL